MREIGYRLRERGFDPIRAREEKSIQIKISTYYCKKISALAESIAKGALINCSGIFSET